MANIKSSEKRIEISERNKIKNRIYKSLIKNYTKKYFLSVEEFKNNPTFELLKDIYEIVDIIYSKIDKALKKNVLHQNTAARKKSQIGLVLRELVKI